MWASLQATRAVWPDAPTEDAVLSRLLQAAYEQCHAFAPALQPDVLVPQRYVEANVLQARELWNSTRREGDLIGFDAYAVRVRPLSATVRALLRPPSLRRALG